MKRIVIKIGTSVITNSNGSANKEILENIIKQVVNIKKNKIDVAIVSSGAVGLGKNTFSTSSSVKNREIKSNNNSIRRKIFSSIGQIKLVNNYFNLFLKHNFFCAQILVTRDDFRSRKHFLHMRDCVEELLNHHIVPILNENDAVVGDLSFFDNDEFAGLTAGMINADLLIILTNVDGLFNGDPENKTSQIIHQILPHENPIKFICEKKSSLGKGGMTTKYKTAKKLSKIGIETVIANGQQKDILLKIFQKEKIGTRFLSAKNLSPLKKWIAVSRGLEKGWVMVNQGAEKAIIQGANILPIGVIKIGGNFKKNDVVQIKNEKEENFGLGIIKKDFQETINLIGQKGQKPLIHSENLFLN